MAEEKAKKKKKRNKAEVKAIKKRNKAEVKAIFFKGLRVAKNAELSKRKPSKRKKSRKEGRVELW